MEKLIDYIKPRCNGEWARQISALLLRYKNAVTCPGGYGQTNPNYGQSHDQGQTDNSNGQDNTHNQNNGGTNNNNGQTDTNQVGQNDHSSQEKMFKISIYCLLFQILFIT